MYNPFAIWSTFLFHDKILRQVNAFVSLLA